MLMSVRGGLRMIAVIEAAKGAIVLAAGVGALEFLGRNAQEAAEALVRQFHLNPAHTIPRIFVEIAKKATPAQLWMLAAGAAAYAIIRFAEAYGLWRGRLWAEWLGVISGSIYVPWEIWELSHGFTWLLTGLLALNLAIVAYLVWALMKSRTRAANDRAEAAARRATTAP